MKLPHIALASFVSLLATWPVLAQLGGAAGVVIPYAGKLELNGGLVTGSFDFRFQVMPNATSTTPCETKTVSAVAVTNGEFALTIPGVSEGCVKNRDVHLIVAVSAAGAGAFTTLGKQRITPTLSALTSSTGDFNAGAQLQAASASISGGVTAGSATISGTTTLSGSLILNPPSGDFIPWTVSAGRRLTFSSFDAVNQKQLSIDGSLNGIGPTTSTVLRSRGTIEVSSTPDLAETIPGAADVEAADVVCADPDKAEHVIRCGPKARGVLGVISDGTSSFLINSRANDIDAPLNGHPLVLAGRVPVKVSTENGPIHIGDELTLSSTPGVAMRASGAGAVVGIALAGFDGPNPGTVLCFVKVAEGRAVVELQREHAAETAALQHRLADLEARLNALEPKTTVSQR